MEYYESIIGFAAGYIYEIGVSLDAFFKALSTHFQLSILIALVALYVAFRNYRRKSGILIYGGASISKDYLSSYPYVSDLILENQKDRAVTIYAIYLKVGHNYYLEIENLEGNPLVLKPYESLRKSYTRAYVYTSSTSLVSLRRLLNDVNVKKRVALSTAMGRYIVPARVKHWSPILDYFHNVLTITVRPWQIEYKGISLGDNIRYCLDVMSASGNSTVVVTGSELTSTLYGIRFPKAALESVTTLEDYLEQKRKEGVIPPGVTIHISPIGEIVGGQMNGLSMEKEIELPYYSFISFKVVGRALTIWQSITIRLSNASMRRKNKKSRQKT